MDAVLQKSMDMTVELTASGKSGRQGCTVATLRADRVSSIPVDHDSKNNNNVVLAGSIISIYYIIILKKATCVCYSDSRTIEEEKY